MPIRQIVSAGTRYNPGDYFSPSLNTPEVINSIQQVHNNALQSQGKVDSIRNSTFTVPEEHLNRVRTLMSLQNHWREAVQRIARNSKNGQIDPRYLHAIGKVLNGSLEQKLMNPGEQLAKTPGYNSIYNHMFGVFAGKGQMLRDEGHMAKVLDDEIKTYKPQQVTVQQAFGGQHPFPEFAHLESTPEAKVGKDFLNLLSTPVSPEAAELMNVRRSDMQSIGTTSKTLANMGLSAFGNVAKPGQFAKSVRLVRRSLFTINDLMLYDPNRAMVEIKKLCDENIPQELHSQFKLKEIRQLKKAIQAIYAFKNSTVPVDLLKAWVTTQTPIDINALPEKKYNELNSPWNDDHEHSAIKTYVEKFPDSAFIDVLLFRLALDDYVSNKKQVSEANMEVGGLDE